MGDYLVLHGPPRPGWNCVACGEEWPCVTRRGQLAELCRTPHMRAVYMAQYLADATADLGHLSTAEVTERIVGCCTGSVNRRHVLGAAIAPDVRPGRPESA
nr:hypothetical protein [Micromonospora sp. DSM 115978]